MHRRLRASISASVLFAAGLMTPVSASAEPSGDAIAAAPTPLWWGNVAASNTARRTMVLDIKDLSTRDGAVVQLWSDNGGDQQRFYSIPSGPSVWKIQNVRSKKCLDTNGPSDVSGTQVHQWTCYGTSSQLWRQESMGTRVVNGRSQEVHRFVNLYGRKTCLDNAGGRGNNGNKIQIWTCNGSANQLWY